MMRRITKGLIVVALLIIAGSTSAQSLKFGHINMRELLMVLPERDSAEVKLMNAQRDMQKTLEELQVEFNKKYQDFLQKEKTYTDAIKELKRKELGELQQRGQEYQATLQQDLAEMEENLMKPIADKMNTTVKKVAKENGFIYIFDVSTGGVVFFSDQSIDIMPLVKKELKLK